MRRIKKYLQKDIYPQRKDNAPNEPAKCRKKYWVKTMVIHGKGITLIVNSQQQVEGITIQKQYLKIVFH